MTRNELYLLVLGGAGLFGAMLSGCAASESNSRAEFLVSDEARQLQLPFSEAVRAGDFLYLSGQIGNIPGQMDLVPGGVVAESRQALLNLERVLDRYGLDSSDIIRCTVYLADMTEWGQFNQIYRALLEPPYPARSAIGVNGLALGARVELECVAYSTQQ